MNAFLSNVASVLLMRPGQYLHPKRPVRTLVLCAVLTEAVGIAMFGVHAMWVLVTATLLAMVMLPFKVAFASKQRELSTDDRDLISLAVRAMFAACVCTWPLGIAFAAHLPAPVLAACAANAALQIWIQLVLPRAAVATDAGGTPAWFRLDETGPQIGTFRGAVDPATKSFREFPAWAEANRGLLEGRKVAMFCTGGIRCEKATAYVKSLGLKNVFHLKGGILKYLEEMPAEESLWRGECFVFDERVSVSHGLTEGEAELCRACRHPLTVEDRLSPKYTIGVSCPHCFETRSDADRERYAERHRQVELAQARGGKRHIGS